MRFDENSAPDEIEFGGVIYRRMGGKRRYYLSQSRSSAGRRSAKGLHVAVWEHHTGRAVPAGHEVHHVDSNTFNFEFANLECLPVSVHRAMPKRNGRERQKEILAQIRPLAAAWHRSPEGREWHRKHAAESIRKPGVKTATYPVIGRWGCVICGTEFEARNRRRIFCSSSCQSVDANRKKKLRRAERRSGLQPDG